MPVNSMEMARKERDRRVLVVAMLLIMTQKAKEIGRKGQTFMLSSSTAFPSL